MWNDFRLAVRALSKSPVFSAAAIGTLSLGIAASTAIFSLYYQVLLRSLPVPAPEQLVLLHSPEPSLPGWRSADDNETVFSDPMYRSLRDGASRAIGSGGALERHGRDLTPQRQRSRASRSGVGQLLLRSGRECGFGPDVFSR